MGVKVASVCWSGPGGPTGVPLWVRNAKLTGSGQLGLATAFGGLPGPSRTFWLGGVFYDQNRIGDPANPSDQSLAGAVARLAGTGDPPRVWWLVAVLVVVGIALVVAKCNPCSAASDSSPTKSPAERSATVASLPAWETTVIFARPSWR